MCGVNGIYVFRGAAPPVDARELLLTRDHMAARGPDGKGCWLSDDGRTGLGHRRLSVIDLSVAGAQPMVSADGRFVITFNGEIYNYRGLRERLEAKGHVFCSQSDTEVLLHLYAERGEAMVRDLRGMFAFGLWDASRRGILLARDPYGIKPLYYVEDGSTLRFASQVKALEAGGKVSKNLEPAGWVGFYMLGSVPEPYTTHRAIRTLPAGSTMWVDSTGAREPKRYWSIAEIYAEGERRSPLVTSEEATGRIRDALFDSVRHHLVADVPVGAFLSGGVDSGALLGLMRDAGQREIQTVTLAFDEFRNQPDDEAPLAAAVAARYGAVHTTRIVTAREFVDDLPHILDAMDQPSIDGVNAWFASKAARELGVKVVISGIGGDELFGGYPSFFDIPRWVHRLALPSRLPFLGKAFRHVASALGLLSGRLSPKAAGLVHYGGDFAGAWYLRRGLYMPWELDRLLDREFVREGLKRLDPRVLVHSVLEPMPRSEFGRVATMEASLYMRNQLLRDTDWASMAHSLEVRMPLVDASLLERIAGLVALQATTSPKRELALAPSRPLPSAVTTRAKTGFGVPIASWTSGRASGASASAYGYAREWGRYVAGHQMAALVGTSSG